MKFLYNSKDLNSVNLANVINIFVSNNYLMLTLTDGREMRFLYDTTENLTKLHARIMQFIAKDEKVLDCYVFLDGLK
jgi:hypothetical protein